MRGLAGEQAALTHERRVQAIDRQLALIRHLCGMDGLCDYHLPMVDDLLDRRLAEQSALARINQRRSP